MKPALIAKPQANGVTGRFNRTSRGQVINCGVLRTVEDVRQAVRSFEELHSRQRRVKKDGFERPRKIRRDWPGNRLEA